MPDVKKILSIWLILIYFVYNFAFLCKIRENEIANLQFHRKHYIRFSDWDNFNKKEFQNYKKNLSCLHIKVSI